MCSDVNPKLLIPPPSAEEQASPVGMSTFPTSTTTTREQESIASERESSAAKGSSKRSPSAGSGMGGRRRPHADPLRTVQHISASGSTERKLNFDFLTSPRRKLYHEWIPKMTAFSKRAAEALTDTRPAVRISSLVQDLSPRLVGRTSEGPVAMETSSKVSSHNVSSIQASLARPHEETINLPTKTSAAEEKSDKSPTNVPELGNYESAVQSPMSESPEFSPQTLTQEGADPFLASVGFPYASQLRFFPPLGPSYPLGPATASMAAPLLSPYTCGSKLQLRFNDEDEDLAVIEQVNRRLAMGQLETNPSLAGPPYLPTGTQAATPGLSGQMQQYSAGPHPNVGMSTLVAGDVCLQPGPGIPSCFFPGAFPLDPTSRAALRVESSSQLSPPAEEPLSEVEMADP
ncbi:Serine/threonine-protein kinase sik3 [Sparganum proliferum]